MLGGVSLGSDSGGSVYGPALEMEKKRVVKGEGFHCWMGRVASREAAGRRVRAIEAIVWLLFGGCV